MYLWIFAYPVVKMSFLNSFTLNNHTYMQASYHQKCHSSKRNKRLLFDGIDALSDHQIANYGQALEFAYEEFERFESEKEAQVCVVLLPWQENVPNWLNMKRSAGKPN